MKARVDFWWRELDQNLTGNGTSLDVSEKGAFVLAAACPSMGADVGLTLFLPKLAKGIAAVRIEVEGKVIRIEDGVGTKGRAGFAVLAKAAILRKNGGRHSGKPEATYEDRT